MEYRAYYCFPNDNFMHEAPSAAALLDDQKCCRSFSRVFVWLRDIKPEWKGKREPETV